MILKTFEFSIKITVVVSFLKRFRHDRPKLFVYQTFRNLRCASKTAVNGLGRNGEGNEPVDEFVSINSRFLNTLGSINKILAFALPKKRQTILNVMNQY